MLTVTIICVGTLKENYWRDACREYEKRLSGYCRFKIIEIYESRLPPNLAVIEEGKRILEKLPSRSLLIPLCIEGDQITSEELAEKFRKWTVAGISSISFVIGGSWGLSDDVKKAGGFSLSFSSMTFPHQLARVMLCEQLYRAFQINSNGNYHK